MAPNAPTPPPEWRIADGLTPYPDAVASMQDRVAAIRAGTASELVWLVEHPPLYTAGTSARPEQLTDPDPLPHATKPAAAASGPTMAPASAWPTSCWTSRGPTAPCRRATCAAT